MGKEQFIKEVFGEEKTFIDANNTGNNYCPACCHPLVEWRTKIVTKPFIFGLFTRKIKKDYLWSLTREDYPDGYTNERGTFCGKCHRMTAIKIGVV